MRVAHWADHLCQAGRAVQKPLVTTHPERVPIRSPGEVGICQDGHTPDGVTEVLK